MQREPATPAAAQLARDDLQAADAERAAARRRAAHLCARIAVGVFVVAVVWLFFAMCSRAVCRDSQSEAKGNLRALFVAVERYRDEHGADSSPDVEALDFEPTRLRYVYSVDVDAADRFVASAHRVDNDDVWRINDHGVLENVVDGCVAW